MAGNLFGNVTLKALAATALLGVAQANAAAARAGHHPCLRRSQRVTLQHQPDATIRRETIAAEDILHDLGAFSMIASDSQAMGRVGEVITRTWQTAHKMKIQRGSLHPDPAHHDNFRIKRYIAKYTINPAIAHGIGHEVGSVAVHKLADLALWKAPFFGVKPSLILKGGMIAAATMGDPNASIPTPQPVHYRPMFGAFGGARHATSMTFVSRTAANGKVSRKSAFAPHARHRAWLSYFEQARYDPQRLPASYRSRCANL